MAIEIVMPRLGWTMEEGSIVEWLKKDGDSVTQGEIVFAVEGDKAVNEVESFESGILRIPPDSPSPGQIVPVGHLLAYLVQPGESAPFESAGSTVATGSATPVTAGTSQESLEAHPVEAASAHTNGTNNGHSNGTQFPSISPRARRISAELGVDWVALTGSGRTGRIVERDIRAAAERQTVQKEQPSPVSTQPTGARYSPVARRAAEDLNVDLDALAATLPAGKRIEKADVERAAEQAATKSAPATISAAPVSAPSIPSPIPPAITAPKHEPAAGETRLPISNVRRITAARMSNSVHTTAPVTLTTEVDATELVALRNQLKQDADSMGRRAPTYNDLLAKLVAESLLEHPALNARFDGEEIVQSSAVHIGIAVDTERGLLVPVIRDVHAKSVRQIARDSAALIERARAGSLTSAEMSGGTFSISNLGMFEIDAFTPIINVPECAILGVGRITPKPVVVDLNAETDAAKVAIRHMLFLSLTFDHRLVDGAPAARFLQAIKRYVEHPRLGLL